MKVGASTLPKLCPRGQKKPKKTKQKQTEILPDFLVISINYLISLDLPKNRFLDLKSLGT